MVFELLAGYVDKQGNIHKECEANLINGEIEEQMAKIKNNGTKMLRVGFALCVTRIGDIQKSDVTATEWDKIIGSLRAQDLDYGIMQIRKESYGSTIEINVKCKCSPKKPITIEKDIDDLNVVPFNGNFEIDFELPIGVDAGNGEVAKTGVLRLPTVQDREIIEPIIRQNPAEATTLILARCVKINGIRNISNHTFKKMIARDREYLMKLMTQNNFGYEFEVDSECPYCGEPIAGSVNIANFI